VDVWDLLRVVFRGRSRCVSPATAAVALVLTALTARFAPGVLEAIAASYTEHVTAVVERQMEQLTDNLMPTTTTIVEEDRR
jgi:hypothetical protein